LLLRCRKLNVQSQFFFIISLALTGLEVTVRDEIDKLNIDIEAMEQNSIAVSGEIAEKMATIEENNAYYNGIVEGMEIELHSFAGTMREMCGDTGALGIKFIDKITELQVRIEETAKNMQVESDVLIEVSKTVSNEEQISGWIKGIDTFQDEWVRFFTSMNKFHIAARMMWESGAYNRGGLE